MLRLLSTILLSLPMMLWAATIEMHDGRVLHGVLQSSSDDDPVVLLVEKAGMRASMRLAQEDVREIRQHLDPQQKALNHLRQQFAAALDDPAASPDNQWELAQGFEEFQAVAELRAAARAVLRDWPDFAPARTHLGYERVDGEWLNYAQARQAQGLEWYDGRWRDAQEAQRLRAIAQAEREERRRQADFRRVQRRLAAEDRRRRWHDTSTRIPVVNIVGQGSHSCPWGSTRYHHHRTTVHHRSGGFVSFGSVRLQQGR
ncbi:MAG: hypothetical protein EA401_06375 [Planctomycetota bacterium]|nr:MAG: hypothetical protein EA401_06375 [Planctomycetota bacterium]